MGKVGRPPLKAEELKGYEVLFRGDVGAEVRRQAGLNADRVYQVERLEDGTYEAVSRPGWQFFYPDEAHVVTGRNKKEINTSLRRIQPCECAACTDAAS